VALIAGLMHPIDSAKPEVLMITPLVVIVPALCASILGMHIWLAILIGRRVPRPSAYFRLAVLSVFTTSIWVAVIFFFVIGCVECFTNYSKPDERTWEHIVFESTFGLPFNIIPCSDLSGLGNTLGGVLCVTSSFMLLPIGLYLLGLGTYRLVGRANNP
jgi:hypothetical protein